MVEASLAALGKPEPPRDHALADRLAADRTRRRLRHLHGAAARRDRGGAARCRARAATRPPWLARHPLAVWAGLWDRLGDLADDTERLNLDRKQAVLTGLSWLARP